MIHTKTCARLHENMNMNAVFFFMCPALHENMCARLHLPDKKYIYNYLILNIIMQPHKLKTFLLNSITDQLRNRSLGTITITFLSPQTMSKAYTALHLIL